MLPSMTRAFKSWILHTDLRQYEKECERMGKPSDSHYIEMGSFDAAGKPMHVLAVCPLFLPIRDGRGPDPLPGHVRSRSGPWLLAGLLAEACA